MAFHTYRIYHYPKTDSGEFTGTGIQLQGVLSVNLTYELDDAADGFSFSINNVVRNEFSDLKIDDRVIIEGSLDGVVYQTLKLEYYLNTEHGKQGEKLLRSKKK